MINILSCLAGTQHIVPFQKYKPRECLFDACWMPLECWGSKSPIWLTIMSKHVAGDYHVSRMVGWHYQRAWCNDLVGAACPLPGRWYSLVENVPFWESTAGPRPSRWYSWPENTTCFFMRLIVIPTIAPGMDSSLTSPRFNAHGRSSADCPRSLATAVFAVHSADCQRRNARDVLTRRLNPVQKWFKE